MIRPIAVIDTDVLILLLDTENNPDVRRRKALVELTFENLHRQNARLVVPSPVVAELCRTGPGSKVLRDVVSKALRKVRIEALDEDAAEVAGEIARVSLAGRAGRERGAVKYDALIAGIAHRIGARWLITGNERDYRKCLSVISSSVEVLVATEQPSRGQQVIAEMMEKPPAAAKKV